MVNCHRSHHWGAFPYLAMMCSRRINPKYGHAPLSSAADPLGIRVTTTNNTTKKQEYSSAS
jgi:hypothetical protein